MMQQLFVISQGLPPLCRTLVSAVTISCRRTYNCTKPHHPREMGVLTSKTTNRLPLALSMLFYQSQCKLCIHKRFMTRKTDQDSKFTMIKWLLNLFRNLDFSDVQLKLEETIQFNPLKTFVSVDANFERLNLNV